METLTTTLTESIKFEKHLSGLETAHRLMSKIKKLHVTHFSALDKAEFKHSLGLFEEAREARIEARRRLRISFYYWSKYRKLLKELYHG